MAPVGSVFVGEHPHTEVCGSLGINAAHKTHRQFSAVPTNQHGVEFRVEHSCMDIAGDSFLVGKQHLVVYRALAFWVIRLLLGMWLMGWASACGNQKDPPKENKNHYSVKGRDGNRL